MRAVDSTAISHVGYHELTAELFLQYRAGDIYRYRMVPASVVRELFAAASVGRFVGARIIHQYPNDWWGPAE